MDVWAACVSVNHMYVWCQQRSEAGVGSPGTGDPGNCDPPCGCLELNPGPLEEQLVLLIAEPSLQSYH